MFQQTSRLNSGGGTTLLKHLKISQRLALVVAMPLVLLVGLAAYMVEAAWAERQEMEVLGEFVGDVAKISRFVHELQIERGLSAIFLSSKGAQMRSELLDQRKRTDSEHQDTVAAMKLLAAVESREIRDAIANIEVVLKSRDSRRNAVDGQTTAVGDSSAYYTDTIAKLLSLAKMAVNMSSKGDVTTALSAYLNLLQGKEHAGQERALVAAGISGGRFDLLSYRKVLGQQTAQDIYLADFLSGAKAEQRDFYKRTLSSEVVESVNKMRDVVVNGSLSGNMPGIDSSAWFRAATGRIDLLKKVEDKIANDLSLLTSAKHQEATRTLILLASIIVVGTLLTAVVVLRMARSIIRPVAVLSGAMRLLANGNMSVSIEGADRRDEIGGMAAAVEVFKRAMIEADKLRAEQAAAESRRAAERKADMMKLADQFEQAIGGIISSVSTASNQLEASARTLTATANRAEEMTTTVAAASEEASTNVQSVASATEELSSSVNEISRQVQESARIAADATGQARFTTEQVGELSQAAGRIGDVVELINAIAGQTNLLALNATIEAARAGDAGRGFAVVASEVKALAEQTARATGEISQQIAGIQAATGESVNAIKAISGTIEKLSEISSTISASIEEQGAATQEISRNVQQAALGTQQVSSNVIEVQRGAYETGSACSQVFSAAQSLSGESSRLRDEVGRFLTNVRAA